MSKRSMLVIISLVITVIAITMWLFVEVDYGINPQPFEDNGYIYTSYELEEGFYILDGYWEYEVVAIISVFNNDFIIIEL